MLRMLMLKNDKVKVPSFASHAKHDFASHAKHDRVFSAFLIGLRYSPRSRNQRYTSYVVDSCVATRVSKHIFCARFWCDSMHSHVKVILYPRER